jgi:hypothetical protein
MNMSSIELRSAVGRLGTLVASVPNQNLGQPTPCTEYRVGAPGRDGPGL